MYILIAIIGYFFLAVTNIFDKFLLTKAVKSAALFVFYSTALVTPILVLVPFGVGFLKSYFDWLMAIGGGVFFVFALWAMYKGFQDSEISHAGPLVGAATPFFVLIFSYFFLSETLTVWQFSGVIVLIFGSLLISFEKSKKHHGIHKAMLWIIFAGLLYAVSHVCSKYVYDVYGFYAGLVWTRGFMGIAGLFLLFNSSVRTSLFKKEKKKDKNTKEKQLFLVFSSRMLAVVAVILIQYSIAIGSVTIVNALAGVQFALLVILVAFLTKFVPKLFKEKFVRGELKIELLAVVVIAIGLALIIK